VEAIPRNRPLIRRQGGNLTLHIEQPRHIHRFPVVRSLHLFSQSQQFLGHPDCALVLIGQLKLIQEVITLSVFVPFAVYYLKEPLKLDYLWAALCILGAVYFVFRGKLAGA
jgi:hypothetical protein